MAEIFRVRNTQINLRVTEYEKALIMERVKATGSSSIREYVVSAAINNYIVNIDYAELKGIAYEINKIGTNINQIAHRINADQKNAVYQIDMDKLQDDMEKIWRVVRTKLLQ